MKEQINQYKTRALAWWQQREPREQGLLSGLAVVLLIAFIWFLVWQPFQNSVTQLESRVAAQQETLRYVAEGTAQVRQLRQAQGEVNQTSAVTSSELTSFISEQTSELELNVSRLQPQGESIQVALNEADFDRLLELLARLSEHQVEVELMDISETSDAGVVRVRRLQLRAGA
ncbi:type II secretion system protein GspM [Aliidiomarina sp. Khilg15.8]